MKRFIVFVGVLVLTFAAGAKGAPTVADVNHWDLQAVDGNGTATYEATDKVIVRGIILNNPEYMLDPEPNDLLQQDFMGGQWQIYIQGEGDDHAGTAVYMAQNYGNGPGTDNYTNEEWLSEWFRINHDPNTGHTFRAGDRVKVTGWYKFYKGKVNINEQHFIEPVMDFNVELLEQRVGLPAPEVISLDDVKDGNDNYIFDHTRLTGCEHYQARLVRVDDVNIVDPENWGIQNTGIFQTLTIKDSNGLTFPIKLGIGYGFTEFACPTGQIDVIGIFDQEGETFPPPHKDGYRIWVVNYDGNGKVLTDFGWAKNRLPGDINMDCKVDFCDFAELASDWLKVRE